METDSLYTRIDNILKEFGIIRAEYHGGDLNGVHLKKLMECAGDIMDQVTTYFINSLHYESSKTETSIRETCQFKLFLTYETEFIESSRLFPIILLVQQNTELHRCSNQACT